MKKSRISAALLNLFLFAGTVGAFDDEFGYDFGNPFDAIRIIVPSIVLTTFRITPPLNIWAREARYMVGTCITTSGMNLGIVN